MIATSAIISDYDFQTAWIFCIFLISILLNVRQIIKWLGIESAVAHSIRMMSAVRGAISAILSIGYGLELFGLVSFEERSIFFIRYLAPLYWPLLLILPVLMLPNHKIDLDEDVLRAEIERIAVEILYKETSDGDVKPGD